LGGVPAKQPNRSNTTRLRKLREGFKVDTILGRVVHEAKTFVN